MVTDLPCSSSTVAFMASLYLRPSWKMWPTSMPRAMPSVPLPVGLGSPAHDVAEVDDLGLGQVAAPVDAGQVHVRSLAPQTKSASVRRRAVDVDLAAAGRPGRGSPARSRSPRGTCSGARHAQRRRARPAASAP